MSNDMVTINGTGVRLPEKLGGTLEHVLDDRTLNEKFGGKDGKLSTAQVGLAVSVVVKMQDRLIEHIKESHNREMSLVAGFSRLYRTPVFQIAAPPAEDGAKKSGAERPLSWKSLFTWGNVLGGAAIIMVALSFYYTKLTANYKVQAQEAEAKIEELRKEVKAEYEENRTLSADVAREKSRADATEQVLKGATGQASEQQKELLQAIKDLSQQKADLAKQVSSSAAEKKFEALYERSEAENKRLRDENSTVREENAKLHEKLKQKAPTA